MLDPLYWERNVISTDQFGAPLESEGHCTSDNWVAFAATIASLHLLLLGVACWMCYGTFRSCFPIGDGSLAYHSKLIISFFDIRYFPRIPVARDIPTKFSEGKYLSIAMISNLQVFARELECVFLPSILLTNGNISSRYHRRSSSSAFLSS